MANGYNKKWEYYLHFDDKWSQFEPSFGGHLSVSYAHGIHLVGKLELIWNIFDVRTAEELRVDFGVYFWHSDQVTKVHEGLMLTESH